jgi:hypothetical protein
VKKTMQPGYFCDVDNIARSQPGNECQTNNLSNSLPELERSGVTFALIQIKFFIFGVIILERQAHP